MDFSSHSPTVGAPFLAAASIDGNSDSPLGLQQRHHTDVGSGLGGSLAPALMQSYEALVEFYQRDSFEASMAQAFGPTYDLTAANRYFDSLIEQGVEGLGDVALWQGDDLTGINGLYVQNTDRVYLTESFLEGANVDAITGVLLEEFGHGLDAKVNRHDAAGDEGDILARLVLGEAISPQQLQQLRTEDDRTSLALNGELLTVEMSAPQEGQTGGAGSNNGHSQPLDEPAITSFRGKLFQSHRGLDNGIYNRYSEDGVQWSPWEKTEGGTLDTPSLEVFNHRLYQTVRGGDNGIYTRSSDDGFFWGEWENHGGATLDAPIQSSFAGKLYQSVRGGDNGVYIRSSQDGRHWSHWSSMNGGTLSAPELTEFQGQLVQAVRGGDNAIHMRTSKNGMQWTAWQQTGGAIASAIEMTVVGDQLHQSVIGLDGERYARISSDAINWSEFTVIAQETIASPVTTKTTTKTVNSEPSDLKKYWFYYSYNPDAQASADSYLGSVIAPKGTYQVAPTLAGGGYDPAHAFNPNARVTEANTDGKYLIYREEDYDDALVSDIGKVFILTYTDRDGGSIKSITPHQYAQNAKPSGLNFLGSELDYISPTQHAAVQFGQDYFEADLQNPDIDIQAYRPQGIFAPNQLNAINTAISNWEQLIVSDKDSSGILKIAFTHSFQRIHGSNWNGVWGEAYIDQLTGERMERNSALVDIGGDYDNRINYNTVKLGRLSSSELIRLTMHEIGHTLGLDEAQVDSLLGLDSVMDKRGLDANITEGMFQRLETLGYGVDRTAVSRLKWF